MTTRQIRIEGMHQRHPGLTAALSQSYAEAAAVCFARHHQSPVTLSLQRGMSIEYGSLEYPAPDARVQAAYANEIDATECGAYSVCLAAIEVVEGLVAVRRAETLTGADWYISRNDQDRDDDLENSLRLEVSGTSNGTSSDVQRRLQEKVAQAARGASNLPALAAVVGFKVLEVAIAPIAEAT